MQVGNIDLRLGDCLDVLKTFESNSIDSIVTDSPYGLEFMNKKWDYDVPSVEIWTECLRVLKPGGHLLSFAGSRTYHRMAVRIEDAGFEIRDQIMWVYGSGFPKSLNIGKAVDKIEGNDREVIGDGKWNNRKPNGSSSENSVGLQTKADFKETKGNSEWEGWGTSLKPAHEPIVMARKPLSEKSIAENVLKHGTGGINIDGSRIETSQKDIEISLKKRNKESLGSIQHNWETTSLKAKEETFDISNGRFPANIIFDEEAGQLLDEQSGISKSGNGKANTYENKEGGHWGNGKQIRNADYGDKGGASRFFYCPKTSKKDRNEGLEKPSSHPTVKPTDLMRYLINLVTPKGGTTLDPFMGSGSTGKAAVRCGVNFIGIEKEQEYMEIAKARIEHEKNKPVQTKLL